MRDPADALCACRTVVEALKLASISDRRRYFRYLPAVCPCLVSGSVYRTWITAGILEKFLSGSSLSFSGPRQKKERQYQHSNLFQGKSTTLRG
ncbi:hypothetical protein BaRGS_00022153, partial [Batillaria attramentaria]